MIRKSAPVPWQLAPSHLQVNDTAYASRLMILLFLALSLLSILFVLAPHYQNLSTEPSTPPPKVEKTPESTHSTPCTQHNTYRALDSSPIFPPCLGPALPCPAPANTRQLNQLNLCKRFSPHIPSICICTPHEPQSCIPSTFPAQSQSWHSKDMYTKSRDTA